MFVLESDKVIFVDVDDTLIFWPNGDPSQPKPGATVFIDPRDGEVFHGWLNEKLIKTIKKHRQFSKHTIVVWSASGYQWAEAAVKLCGLQDYVSAVMSKPFKYYDDIALKHQSIPWQAVEKPSEIRQY